MWGTEREVCKAHIHFAQGEGGEWLCKGLEEGHVMVMVISCQGAMEQLDRIASDGGRRERCLLGLVPKEQSIWAA